MNFQKKAMLRRVSALGLEPVAENASQNTLTSSAVQNHAINQEENGQSGGNPIKEGSIATNVETTDEENTEKCYPKQERDAVFPIQEIYTDPASGLEFNTFYSPASGENAPLFICHHGAGSSAMTFWCLAKTLRNYGKSKEEIPGIFAFDARGHGGNPHNQEFLKNKQYTLDDFTSDFAFLISEFVSRNSPENPICLVGHSLGGAVLTNYIDSRQHSSESELNIRGLVVVDIVEETAVRSLVSISNFLSKRPRSFSSHTQAVQWHLQSRLLRNEESAKISVPELLVKSGNGEFAWKASLPDMAQSWDTWFCDLSSKFLDCRLKQHKLSKLLILSSNETLDKGLTIGQMQGKFQLIVFNNSTNAGHFLHEDIPGQIATSLMEFMRRYSSANVTGVSKNVASLWGGKIHS